MLVLLSDLKFHKCNSAGASSLKSGASSLKYSRDIEKHGRYSYNVEASQLDEEAALRTCNDVSCFKMDTERAEISASNTGRQFLERNQPYNIIE